MRLLAGLFAVGRLIAAGDSFIHGGGLLLLLLIRIAPPDPPGRGRVCTRLEPHRVAAVVSGRASIAQGVVV